LRAAKSDIDTIWWVEFDPTQGAEIPKNRPTVVLTADGLNRIRRTVVVVSLSTGPTPRPPIIMAVPSAGVGPTGLRPNSSSGQNPAIAK
jgi:mRNA-degrading endonuclease toxin of MazEF toxin-antitoxin module